jgi:hypothetical protein
MVDFYARFKLHHVHVGMEDIVEEKKYKLSKWFTFGWGIFCIVVAEFSTNMGSLIQAVNEYGSLFYGVILGIFLVAFYMKKIKGNAVFYSAIIGEILVVTLYILDKSGVIGFSFLWLNVVGAFTVITISWTISKLFGAAPAAAFGQD